MLRRLWVWWGWQTTRRRVFTVVGAVALIAVVSGGAYGVVQRATPTSPDNPDIYGDAPPTVAQGTPKPAVTRSPLPAGKDWTQYRFDTVGTGANPENTLTSKNIARVATRWTADGGHAFESTPAIVRGVVYITNGNSLLAYDMRTGALRWHFDGQPQQIATLSSSVAVDPATHLAYYGSPDARVYAVDTRTGKGVWNTQLDATPGAFIWSSPLLVNGMLYIGLASHDDHPCIRGGVFALNPATGKLNWSHYTVPPGALGGAVWSSLIANATQQELIVTTGNPCDGETVDAEQDAILGLDWNTGATKWIYTALQYDDCDCDFGEGALDVTYDGQEYIVAGNKYGTVYGLKRGSDVSMAWSTRISGAGYLGEGGIFQPPSYSNGMVYVAGGPTEDGVCDGGGLYALHIDTGQVAWRVCTTGQVVSPGAFTSGMLFVAQTDSLTAYDPATGKTLAQWAQPGPAWGGVAIARGFVFSGTVSGKLYCYSLPSA